MADRPVVVVGAGGHGREAHQILVSAGRTVLGFVDDDPALDHGATAERLAPLGAACLGATSQLADIDGDVVVAIGASERRAEIVARIWHELGERAVAAVAAVHRDATVGAGVQLGRGVLVGPGARLTTNVRLAEHVHVGANAVLGHDVDVAATASIYPGAVLSGAVQVGPAATVGAGATVLPSVRIGAAATVGAGAVVVDDVADGEVVVGVPARAR